MAWMVSRRHPLRGLRGGDDAGALREPLPGGHARGVEIENAVTAQLPAGAVIAYQYGGGAGFETRAAARPRGGEEDVLDEYVSVAAARERYGVVLRGSLEAGDLAVDAEATASAARRARSAAVSWRVGIDIGGTFTDFALQKGDAIVLEKTLSTPADRSLAVMQGLEKLAAREGLALRDFLARVDAIVHGTTVADNTLIEGNGAVHGPAHHRRLPRRARAPARLQGGHLGRAAAAAAPDRAAPPPPRRCPSACASTAACTRRSTRPRRARALRRLRKLRASSRSRSRCCSPS